ncbi:MAG: sugar ABC transporter ATP-binding protein [Ktedonobacteraceae bacterium]
MRPSEPIIELVDVAKQFGAVRALRAVSFTCVPGEVHALLGENGAGKSTLVKILAGVHRPDSGEMRVRGRAIELHGPLQAQQLGIAVIQQHPTLFPDLDVAENVFMGRHPRDRTGRVDWKRMYRDVEELLATLEVNINVSLPVRTLSVADQQLVEIAKALSLHSEVLVMDEPTAALSAREVEDLFSIVRQLRARGTAIVFVSHRLEEIAEIADRVTVLRDGAHIITAPIAELTSEQMIRHMVGRELTMLFPKEEAQIGEVVLDVRNLARKGVFQDIQFQLRRGEILGFAGLVGAGRTEVARAIFGIDRIDAGEILIKGQFVHIATPKDAMKHGLAYVPEDRHRQGLVLEFPIAVNITLPILDQVRRMGLMDTKHERRIASNYFKQLDIRASGVDQLVQALSGGNQQKVVLAKWMATRPSILILDEPTLGIDIGAKAEVHRIISHLATEGMAIILISSELPEVLAMSDRILVMHEGRIADTFDRSQADPEKVMFAATGQVINDHNQ